MKKAPIAVALVLVFGLFAAAFSLAPAVAQNTTSTDTDTAGTDTTGTANTTTSTTTNTTGETFSASGSIATLIFDTGETTTTSELDDFTSTESNDTSMTGDTTSSMSGNTTTMMPQVITGNNTTGSSNITGTSNDTTTTTSDETSTTAEEIDLPYVLAGDWNLDVQDGNVSDFAANFSMVHIDGTARHSHDLSNFVSSNSSTIDISGERTSFIFGTVDVAADGQPKWTGVDALIIIEKNNVVTISVATEDTDDHFMGQPIYGIVDSMTDENGNEMIDTGTSPAGNVTGGNTTSGNQTDGGFSGNLTSGIQDLFNGTGQ